MRHTILFPQELSITDWYSVILRLRRVNTNLILFACPWLMECRRKKNWIEMDQWWVSKLITEVTKVCYSNLFLGWAHPTVCVLKVWGKGGRHGMGWEKKEPRGIREWPGEKRERDNERYVRKQGMHGHCDPGVWTCHFLYVYAPEHNPPRKRRNAKNDGRGGSCATKKGGDAILVCF